MADDATDQGSDQPWGYLFAHFREDQVGHAEKIFLSLSRGDTPLRWDPLNGNEPVLESLIGTTGVRDPAIVRDAAGRFHILATDLRVWANGPELDWPTWRRAGSRSLVVWHSEDLVHWSEPRLVEVAPPEAGMAWAPETTVDPETGEHIVFWSSRLFSPDDPDHREDSYSRILYARTRDFETFGPAGILIDTGGRDIIDTAIAQADGRVYRVSKDENRDDDGRGVYLEAGSGLFADDFEVITTRLAEDLYGHGGVEAPILLREPSGRWLLFLDQYRDWPQGYFALSTDDIESGRWEPVPAAEVDIPPSTKHGTILRLTRAEWDRLDRLRAPGAFTGAAD
ncbi:hypothetical protein FHX74_000559 [Friedmanniella endophytica]|uniref:Glycosyl hydrolases family 43 n=1 Tax=Microlunatus kandeliicorticis TaxID=1759536 RepID=A0A7W3IPU8_9ACTN|nr:glycoside hydrolase family 43 protein [Microlunatus kandeliicorticis]MBA8792965.1 hypothetical protein [Microlunatus kandeliicorticis]